MSKQFNQVIFLYIPNYRALIKELDGGTSSPDHWKGPILSRIREVEDMDLLADVTKVDKGPEPLELDEEVVRDMSHDQKIAYRYYKMIRTGKLS